MSVPTIALPRPTAGRECGGCTACCVELSIDDPALRKNDGVPCIHIRKGQGCAIHNVLPNTCRHWYCGWRFLNLSDAMRPDRSHVLLVPEMGKGPDYGKGGLKIVLMEGDEAALYREELLTLIVRCVAGMVPIYLHHGTGHNAVRGLVNERLKEPVARGDLAAAITALRDMKAEMALQFAAAVLVAGEGQVI